MVEALSIPALSPNFTDLVLDRIIGNFKERVNRLHDIQVERDIIHHLTNESEHRLVVTSDKRFILPFERTVVHGLFFGEKFYDWHFRRLNRRLRINSCKRSADFSYEVSNKSLISREFVHEVVSDLFDVSSGLGTQFYGIPEFRDGDRAIKKLLPESGKEFVYIMMDGLNVMPDEHYSGGERKAFARQVWDSYASGISPRLFN